MAWRAFGPAVLVLKFPFCRWNRLHHPLFKLFYRIKSWEHFLDLGQHLGCHVMVVLREGWYTLPPVA